MSSRRQIVFLFPEGDDEKITPQVRGGKGAGLAEMARLGVPVPPGFTVATTVARAFSGEGRLPQRLAWQLNPGVTALERETGKGFGDSANPLLISVRSGAAVSMPGMMDTVLNLGLNLHTVVGLGRIAGKRFAWDCYRRFLAMFGDVVLGISRNLFEKILRDAKAQAGVSEDRQLTAATLQEVCGLYRALIEEQMGCPVPDDPWQQLAMAILAVVGSWNNERAVTYRNVHGIPHWWGTAINVQAMVFGNHGDDSGTGVVFSRNVATGEPGLYGELLINAQGEDVVAGVRTPMPITEMKAWNSSLHAELDQLVRKLEIHYGDVVDVEFTIEKGRLYILQSRKAKRTPEAAVTIATHMVWEKRWSKEEALDRVSSEQVKQISNPAFEAESLAEAVATRLLVQGLPASPGAAVGKAVFSSARAVEMAKAGEQVVLIRPDTSPDDLSGMLKAAAVVTASGGKTSHAAVVCRDLGKPSVVGASALEVSEEAARAGERIVREGDIISVNGLTGVVVVGEVKLAGAARKKEVNIFLRWLERARPSVHEPRIGFEWAELSASANQLLNDFYLSDAMAQVAAGTALERDAVSLKNRVHEDTAECLACYLAIAVAGELRHTWDHSSGVAKNFPAECKTLTGKFAVRRGGDRLETQLKTFDVLKKSSRGEQAEFFRLAATVFDNHGNGWGGAYGGTPWAQIARAPLGFLTGELSHSVFADHAFDLQHNNGSVFGKHNMLSGDRDQIRSQLETKKHANGVVALHWRLSQLCNLWSPQVIELLEKGKSLGIWES